MKKSSIIILFLIGVAIVFLLSTTTKSYSRYAGFGEAGHYAGKEFQVVGNLSKDKPLEYDPQVNPNLFAFYMKDKEGKEQRVVYHSSKPADFERSEDIVITGSMQGNEFVASKILLKCPSKYDDGKLETTEFKANG